MERIVRVWNPLGNFMYVHTTESTHKSKGSHLPFRPGGVPALAWNHARTPGTPPVEPRRASEEKAKEQEREKEKEKEKEREKEKETEKEKEKEMTKKSETPDEQQHPKGSSDPLHAQITIKHPEDEEEHPKSSQSPHAATSSPLVPPPKDAGSRIGQQRTTKKASKKKRIPKPTAREAVIIPLPVGSHLSLYNSNFGVRPVPMQDSNKVKRLLQMLKGDA